MEGRLVDLVEDIGLGIREEQLAPKPADKGEQNGNDNGTDRQKDRK